MDPASREARTMARHLRETVRMKKDFKMKKSGRQGRSFKQKQAFLKPHETLVRALLCAMYGIRGLDDVVIAMTSLYASCVDLQCARCYVE